TMRRFQRGLEDLRRRSRESELFQKRISAGAEKSRLEMLHTIASHGSYHVGQVVLLRQMLGAWPPPSGGLTW
ncbi:MAG TPA: DinB family protein, partial [Vicinamibacteria bacterium]